MLQEPDNFFESAGDGHQRKSKQPKKSASDLSAVHPRELNPDLRAQLSAPVGASPPVPPPSSSSTTSGTQAPRKFGDGGLQWRLTKLKRVFEQAEREGRAVEEVAMDRYGSLEEFQAALRERDASQSRHSSRPNSGGSRRSGDSSRPSTGSGFRRPGEAPPSTSATPRRLSEDRVVELTEADLKRDQLRYTAPSSDSLQRLETDQSPRASNHLHGPPISSANSAGPVMSADELNKLKAKIMKAKLRNDPSVGKLEAEYDHQVALMAAADKSSGVPAQSDSGNIVTLPKFDSRGKYMDVGSSPGKGESSRNRYISKSDRRLQSEKDDRADHDMSIQDILRQEKMSGYTADEEMAKRIAKDGKFDDSLEYMDNQSAKLSKKLQLSNSQKRTKAIMDYTKTQQILDRCWYCLNEDRQPRVPVVAVGVRTYLALPKTVPMVPGHCLIVPAQHNISTLDCEDDEWDEIRNFMKCLMRRFHAEDKGCIFMETSIQHRRQYHTYIECIPVPYRLYDAVPGFFKQAIMVQAEEWSQNRKLIDTSQNGFRRSLVPNLPYFHVWFGLDKGYGHVIEDDSSFPNYFGKEVLAGLMEVSSERWRRPRMLTDEEQKQLENDFRKKFAPFDWTECLK